MNKKTRNIIFFSSGLFLLSFFALDVFSAEEVSRSVDVSKSTKTIILKDSDGDGLLDSEDPHPEIAEIYIVLDENRNGIVDSFEFNTENSEKEIIEGAKVENEK